MYLSPRTRELEVEDLGKVALWQVQSGAANGTETTAGDTHTIDFVDASSTQPSAGAYIEDIAVDFRRAVPENEAVDADNNEIQDMGIDGLDIILTGVSGDADNDAVANLVNKTSKWLQDGNTTTGFTKGRFGLRMDNAPQWNVVPTSTLGFHLKNTTYQYIGERKDIVKFTISLALGGDIATAI